MYKKCSEDGFCQWLLERSLPNKSSGLLKYDYTDFSTGKLQGSIVIHKMGSKDAGMALNFCPFCGFSFYDLYQRGRRVGGGTITFEVLNGGSRSPEG